MVVNVNVVEGDRKRVQAYEGVVIAKRNRGLNSSFIVRKISSGEGVERTFQTYSPLIASIEVKRRGDVRRAKLYYLRERSGKSARIREKLHGAEKAGQRASRVATPRRRRLRGCVQRRLAAPPLSFMRSPQVDCSLPRMALLQSARRGSRTTDRQCSKATARNWLRRSRCSASAREASG